VNIAIRRVVLGFYYYEYYCLSSKININNAIWIAKFMQKVRKLDIDYIKIAD